MEAIGPLKIPVANIHMLSLGINWGTHKIPGEGPPLQWGARAWATEQRIIKTVMQSQKSISIGTTMRVLGEQHHRWEALPTAQEAQTLALDSSDPPAIQAMERMAHALWTEVAHQPIVNFLSQHTAPQPIFGNTTT